LQTGLLRYHISHFIRSVATSQACAFLLVDFAHKKAPFLGVF